MTDELLIDVSDFEAIRQMTPNLDAKKIMPFVFEAQQFDIKPFLGDALYYDLLKSKTAVKYQSVLNGLEYVNGQTQTVRFVGLKVAIAYFAHGRYVPFSGQTHTASGYKQKASEFSESTPDKTLERMSNASFNSGKAILDDLVKFLDVKASVDYPLWLSGTCGSGGPNSTQVLISGVSRI